MRKLLIIINLMVWQIALQGTVISTEYFYNLRKKCRMIKLDRFLMKSNIACIVSIKKRMHHFSLYFLLVIPNM